MASVVVLLALGLGCARPDRSARRPLAPERALLADEAPAEAQTFETLRAIPAAGRLEGLRHPELGALQSDLDALYRKSDWGLLWIEQGRPSRAARELVSHLAKADAAGLRSEDYDAGALARRLEALGPKTPVVEVAKLDASLSIAALRNVSDLSIGRANPERASVAIEVEGRSLDLASFVARLAASSEPGALLAKVEPASPRYLALRRALARHRELAADATKMPPPDLGKLRPGQRHPGVPHLRRWLATLGDLPAESAAGSSDHYGGEVVLGVERFQERHGLDADGVIGATTMRALSVPIAARARQLELALERWRWLPRSFSAPPIVVNVPEFRLYALDGPRGGDPIEMRVIVGKALETETPIFSGEMEYLVFRPYWNVPYSIVTKEMIPKLRSAPATLARDQLEIVTGSGRVTTAVNASTLAGLASGAYGLRQRPGAQNSLGLVKFIFPNDENVYLHGTPAKGLFSRRRRDFSHGCIRVEDPVALAEHVLRGVPGWSRERIEAAMASGNDRRVDLAEPIPVHVVYMTAVASVGGQVSFFEDLYGHDAELARELAGEPARVAAE